MTTGVPAALVQRVERQVDRPRAGADRRPGRARLAGRRPDEAPVEPVVVGVRRLGDQRRVVEQQRRLVAGAARGQVAAREEPAGPGHQLLGQGVGFGAGLRDRRLRVGRRRRELLPPRDHVGARIARDGAVDDVPDVVGEAAGDAFLRRQAADGRRRIAQGRAVLVVPRDVERLAVALEAERPAAFAGDDAEALRRVELVDPVERRQLQAALSGVRVEAQRPGADHRVVGDLLGGFEVVLDLRILHRLHVAEVGEALAADRIARGVDAGLDVDPGEVADGVRVLGAGQTPDGDTAGVTGVLRVELAERRADPGDDGGAFGVGGEVVGVVRRRHVAALEHEHDVVPDVRLLGYARRRHPLGQLVEIDVGLGAGAGVAVGAVPLEGRRRGGGSGFGRGEGPVRRYWRNAGCTWRNGCLAGGAVGRRARRRALRSRHPGLRLRRDDGDERSKQESAEPQPFHPHSLPLTDSIDSNCRYAARQARL